MKKTSSTFFLLATIFSHLLASAHALETQTRNIENTFPPSLTKNSAQKNEEFLKVEGGTYTLTMTPTKHKTVSFLFQNQVNKDSSGIFLTPCGLLKSMSLHHLKKFLEQGNSLTIDPNTSLIQGVVRGKGGFDPLTIGGILVIGGTILFGGLTWWYFHSKGTKEKSAVSIPRSDPGMKAQANTSWDSTHYESQTSILNHSMQQSPPKVSLARSYDKEEQKVTSPVNRPQSNTKKLPPEQRKTIINTFLNAYFNWKKGALKDFNVPANDPHSFKRYVNTSYSLTFPTIESLLKKAHERFGGTSLSGCCEARSEGSMSSENLSHLSQESQKEVYDFDFETLVVQE